MQTDAPLSTILHPPDRFPACTCTAVTHTHSETQAPITSTTVTLDFLLYQTGGDDLQGPMACTGSEARRQTRVFVSALHVCVCVCVCTCGTTDGTADRRVSACCLAFVVTMSTWRIGAPSTTSHHITSPETHTWLTRTHTHARTESSMLNYRLLCLDSNGSLEGPRALGEQTCWE